MLLMRKCPFNLIRDETLLNFDFFVLIYFELLLKHNAKR